MTTNPIGAPSLEVTALRAEVRRLRADCEVWRRRCTEKSVELDDAHSALDACSVPRLCPDDEGRLSLGGRIREWRSMQRVTQSSANAQAEVVEAARGLAKAAGSRTTDGYEEFVALTRALAKLDAAEATR